MPWSVSPGIGGQLAPDWSGHVHQNLQAGHVFIYTDDGNDRLTSDEVEEVIELISHYRDTPKLWSI